MPDNSIKELKVTSTAFKNGEAIPIKYTAQDENISIPIAWEGGPEGTKCYVLIADDPDAPSPRLPLLTFVHWVVYDIPVEEASLPEAVEIKARLENGSKQGKNGLGKNGYAGPAPPFGEHRYFFKVWALDALLGLDPTKTKKKAVLKAMQGHILAKGQLMGTYKKQK